ncbi:hypothetical protein ACIHFD_49075 [Nonomuraea sp. NPDC051941]|uniref:hypothetical protein n=1 Tax=Nonomuraea sp. NPDC051941 TaxID=3364373 RepID=UPI0037C8A37E
MDEYLNDFRDKLLKLLIDEMDEVFSASVIETGKPVIGLELSNGETVFLEIQPA